jgi:anti-anti-sigma factor
MSSPEFEVQIYDDGTLLVVAASGELDLATAPEVDQALDDWTDGHKALVLDLSGLSFLDSSGIRLLVRARNRVPGRLALVPPPDDVARVLEITGVYPLFRWVRQPGEALVPDET